METEAQSAAKQAHGKALREALAAHPTADRFAIEAVTGRGYRTVTNWLNGHNMPDETAKAAMRRLLGNYEAAGDPVERAVRRSELIEWRQDAVLAVYKRNLYEQQAEAAV